MGADRLDKGPHFIIILAAASLVTEAFRAGSHGTGDSRSGGFHCGAYIHGIGMAEGERIRNIFAVQPSGKEKGSVYIPDQGPVEGFACSEPSVQQKIIGRKVQGLFDIPLFPNDKSLYYRTGEKILKPLAVSRIFV